jgi:hypothetical protein
MAVLASLFALALSQPTRSSWWITSAPALRFLESREYRKQSQPSWAAALNRLATQASANPSHTPRSITWQKLDAHDNSAKVTSR